MQDRAQQIEAFKKRFAADLDDFIARRGGDIGAREQWKVDYAKFIPPTPGFGFEHNETKECITFTLHDVPPDLTAEEALAMRKYCNEQCAEAGFIPNKTRMTHLSSELMARVRQGDDDAWMTFATKHHDKLVDNAAKLFAKDENPSILEPEDIANQAIFSVFKDCKDGRIGDAHPHPRMFFRSLNGVQLVPKKLAKGPSGPLPHNIAAEEYDGRVEKLQEQLPAVIERAKKDMSRYQLRVLDWITSHPGDEWSNQSIGRELEMTGENVRQHIRKITRAIKDAAHSMGEDYEETANYIDHLVRANSEGPILRH